MFEQLLAHKRWDGRVTYGSHAPHILTVIQAWSRQFTIKMVRATAACQLQVPCSSPAVLGRRSLEAGAAAPKLQVQLQVQLQVRVKLQAQVQLQVRVQLQAQVQLQVQVQLLAQLQLQAQLHVQVQLQVELHVQLQVQLLQGEALRSRRPELQQQHHADKHKNERNEFEPLLSPMISYAHVGMDGVPQ